MNFFVNEAMGIGNSGVEHAQFYRAKRFEQANLPYKFVFMELVENLHEAMDKWHIREDKVLNMWEYFVLGDSYAKNGVKTLVNPVSETVIDSTNTNRLINSVTASNLRIVKHVVKYPNPDKEGQLLVSVNRIELFNGTVKKVSYETLVNPHGGSSVIQNVHLFRQPGSEHLFFRNDVQLRRYFFQQIDRIFGVDSTFIIDRSEDTQVALMTDTTNPKRRLVNVVHADHLADRNDPKNPLWNNYYEYVLTHLNLVDRLVVATKLQREDLLIDFPDAKAKITAIPVGGVSDKKTKNTKKDFGTPFKLVTISRLASEKHIDLIIRAVIKLQNDGHRVTLDVYGAGGEQGKLADLIKNNHAEKYIELKGLTHHAVEKYPKYDAFISASYSEGFGLTYIEALNGGLPVVTFNARFGAQELIHDGENGVSLPFKRDDEEYNVQELYNGILRLQSMDYPKLKQAVENSVTEFRNAKIARSWEELINGLRNS
ncbi:glycosyltransferase [Pediococcus claussenii]|uniref:Glycosyl transferases group 1 family protein n=1 Tax=Pediococcus claussenii (strain ATCC BAA-344 / DSM 14800 / JCM 18046 / KCTC 3811 / LMG 21948 / P06) TaxID=701521 RepID=G8PCD3_PEDCP|nr:glycosyltransferase [Pediococcus claussenii]AEV94918.1 glycosyl transferases group 1 family protein [Pediococcus claussenii ATCC BAA-344]ANZ70114.1 glycosyl transferase [Pediococcus claussenii]ANZ71929.1 glycosyl transferase [Pediococcus claussenii]KRN18832.1 hypothetical protein IV79_GL000330 [Pediococcus claussenii]